MKKCVIIGSGLGGLACGCILAKNDYEVTVLEQGEQFGGCLQCFRRGDTIFETGMHYIGSADSGQTLHAILKFLGVNDGFRLARLDPMGYDVVSFQGGRFRFANGRDNFIDTLAEHFPRRRDELARYFDLIKTVASSSAMHSLNKNVDLNIHAEYQRRSVNEVIGSLVEEPLLRQVLAGILPLYAGEENRTPFSTHALIFDFYNQSAFRIIGGSSLIAKSMVDVIKGLGGKVLVRHKAEKIKCDDTHATAVITSDDECFPADLVISSIHPKLTMRLVESRLLRPAYRYRLENARNTMAAFTVYLKFRKNTVRYMDSNLYFFRGDSIWGCENYDQDSWPKYLLYMHFCHEENPAYAQAGEIITYMSFDEMKPWLGTHVGQRGESYEDFKRRKAEKVIGALSEEVPGISENIEQYYTSTPLTYLDYTGTPEGSMYGVAKDVNCVGAGRISPRTNIPNLLLTGQSITMHGMLGVLAGSLVTCSEVLKNCDIISQLRQYD
ncbi:MAG: NAD(P)/FAD-dependent oxidoreductase [Prevotella sp.]|nr:NAD(P)/FAD-dependent oxidoreductase [Prevotella sp.]MBR6264498.1 NAD(P)/FAD-dependent oxidoreductase [Prevotella sp.]